MLRWIAARLAQTLLVVFLSLTAVFAMVRLSGDPVLLFMPMDIQAKDVEEYRQRLGFNINPHYKEADPMMAPGSETRDDRIREYHVVNRNPVVGLEEGALVRIERGKATALGTARIKIFRPSIEPVWYAPGDALPVK